MNVARIGIDTVGGGLIIGPGDPHVLVEGAPVACVGDLVANHGVPPHDAAVLVGCSTLVTADGKKICRLGDLASCGHAIQTGSATVIDNSP